jgi:hypothetical protein
MAGRRVGKEKTLRLLLHSMLVIAAAGLPVSLGSMITEPASASGYPALAALPAAPAYSTAGSLAGVAAASDSNAWAVGYAGTGATENMLMLHWNGSKWSRVTSPKVLTEPGQISAITVVSTKDAWAVGSTGSTKPRTMILHWNGTAWSAVTSPAPVANGRLSAVTANATSGWAVGWHSTGPSVPQTSPVIFKLTGTKWSRVDPTFGTGSGATLNGVATTSATNTFATGLYTGMITGQLARWQGSSWSWVKSFPEEGTYHWLNGIAAGPGGIAFAVGINTSGEGGPVSIEWTGHAWVKASIPSSADPYAVAFAPGGTAWAAGDYYSGTTAHTLILDWAGHAWTRVASPATAAQLNGLGFSAANYGWAVGQTQSASGSPKTYIAQWNGHSWS